MSAETETQDRLEYLRSQIRAECISWGELAELQDLADEINEGDIELLEWAGVPEFKEDREMDHGRYAVVIAYHQGTIDMVYVVEADSEGSAQRKAVALGKSLPEGTDWEWFDALSYLEDTEG